jgi:hypothetical protein
MNADMLSAFVPSGSGPDARGARSASHAGSWQQQFQCAQAVGWFCRSEALSWGEKAAHPSTAHPCPPRPPAGPRTQAGIGAVSTRGSPPVASASCARAHEPSGTSGSGPRQTESHSLAARGATPCECVTPHLALSAADSARVEQSVPDLDHPEAAPRLQAAAKQDGPSAPRIHIEEGPRGVHLWLGIDSTLAEVNARASAVAAELRWHCERAGLRLAAITCNGVSIPTGASRPVSQREEP